MTNTEAQKVLATMLMRHDLTDAELEALVMAGEALEEEEWISVEDRLPQTNLFVLLYYPEQGYIVCGFRNAAGKWVIVFANHQVTKGPVTHWRYLPKPPEVD